MWYKIALNAAPQVQQVHCRFFIFLHRIKYLLLGTGKDSPGSEALPFYIRSMFPRYEQELSRTGVRFTTPVLYRKSAQLRMRRHGSITIVPIFHASFDCQLKLLLKPTVGPFSEKDNTGSTSGPCLDCYSLKAAELQAYIACLLDELSFQKYTARYS